MLFDFEVFVIRMKVVFISSMEMYMLSNIFLDCFLFNDLKYLIYNQYFFVIVMFIMCYKKFKMKFKLKYFSNIEDCFYFVKGFLVCLIKD